MIMQSKTNQSYITSLISEYIPDWANAFYQAKKVEGVSSYTLSFYKQQLEHFMRYCEGQVIQQISQITSGNFRNYLLWLEEMGHNPGGQHAAYQVLKTFLRWYEFEYEPENWRNPISKVKAPRLTEEPLEPVALSDIHAMIKTCKPGRFLDFRDKAILYALLDTGARAREFLAINLDDVNFISGAISIRIGMGRKLRTVFLGQNSRKAIRSYIKKRNDGLPAL